MLRAIVQSSLRQPFLVLALAAAMLVIGYRNLRNAPLDVFPEFAPPLVEIQTEAPGLSTEEVESLVTVPLENSLNGTPDLKTIRSKSVLGLSSIVLIFQEGTDLMQARQLVGERLAIEASRLPVVSMPPVILSPLSSTSRVLKIGIWSDKDEQGNDVMSQMEMSELARWTIRPRLMSIAGVANVAIWGQRDRQYQVLVDPERLRAHNLPLADVERAASDAALVSGGGFIDTPNQRLAVRHVSTIVTAEDLARTVVAFRGGAPLRLGDVAEIKEGFPPPIGDAIINDVEGLLLIVEKQPAGNTLDVTKVYQVTVWGVPEVRGDLEAIRNCLIGTPSGGHVMLSEVADITIVPAPNIIKRESASRRIDVTCNVRDRDLGSVAVDIETEVRQVDFERGYHPEFLGEYAAQQASRRQMILMGILALAGIVVLIYSEFRAWRLVSLVMLSFAFAMVGGIVGVWFGGGSLSLGSLVGFVTVVGIAVRNGIMMISHYRHLEVEEGMEFGSQLAIRGAEERLAPILMTALTAALALLPLAIAGNKPGHEIEYPMALVIIGGLVSSTLMNLFFMPSLYCLFGRVNRTQAFEE